MATGLVRRDDGEGRAKRRVARPRRDVNVEDMVVVGSRCCLSMLAFVCAFCVFVRYFDLDFVFFLSRGKPWCPRGFVGGRLDPQEALNVRFATPKLCRGFSGFRLGVNFRE